MIRRVTPAKVVAQVRWRLLRRADRHGISWVQTVRSGPAVGLKLGTAWASADYRSGTNEGPVQEAVASRLGPGDVFYDLGANVGFFSLLAARIVGPEGAVVAVEAHPEVHAALVANIARNRLDNVRTFAVAVADETGRRSFAEADHPGGGALDPSGDADFAVGHVEVDTVRLDDLVERHGLRPPTMVKLDIEAGELAALRGAEATLRSARPVVLVELDAPSAFELEAKRELVAVRLERLGYGTESLAPSYPNRSWHVVHVLATPHEPAT